MKTFQTEGPCDPQLHYMVNSSRQMEKANWIVEEEKYCTLALPPRYGKTTFLQALVRQFRDQYYVICMDFQDAGEAVFEEPESNFVNYFNQTFQRQMRAAGCPEKLIHLWQTCMSMERFPYPNLSGRISELCKASDRGVLLLLDVDAIDANLCSGQWLTFQGVLRHNFLQWQMKKGSTFQSVLVAGIQDARFLRHKERPLAYSPWNIAVAFPADMSFSAEEIAGMLQEYETDHQSGMNIAAVSQELRRLTSGHPYLVSWLCQWLDQNSCASGWTAAGVREAGKAYLQSNCPLLDRFRNAVDKEPKLREKLCDLLFFGTWYSFVFPTPDLEVGLRLGILDKGEGTSIRVANPLFEEFFRVHVAELEGRTYLGAVSWEEERTACISDGRLDMVQLLNRFQAYLKAAFQEEDRHFWSDHCWPLFLYWLRRVLPIDGEIWAEPKEYMNLVISLGAQQYLVALRFWTNSGDWEWTLPGLEQFMDRWNADVGYLVTLSLWSTACPHAPQGWLQPEKLSRQIYEVVLR